MLSAKAVSRLFEPVNDVSSDLIVKLRSVRDTEGDISLAKRLPREIYNWSMEGGRRFNRLIDFNLIEICGTLAVHQIETLPRTLV